ncbi:MAG: fibrobacter succinogenes major paralogous domain-containing protein, partial [Prevotellaceae bacterium]|nr:fibrobacter succinogenes major paralogous domain-containing protein [Prevotellaceae bacterium]
LKLKLYVIYNDGNADRAIELNTSLQDCACCGAKVSSTEWLDFMCHNLGADEAADPFTPSAANHGAKYKWGVKTVALTQAQDQDPAYDSGITDWTNITPPPGTTGINWLSTDNPCPPGWRVPTIEEWQSVIDNNDEYRTDNGTSWTVANATQSWSASNTDFDNGIKFGDALVLPAAGYRSHSNGSLSNRGQNGDYWSSTANTSKGRRLYILGNDHGADANDGGYRSYGFSVRCVAE